MLRIRNGHLVVVCSNGEKFKVGAEMNKVVGTFFSVEWQVALIPNGTIVVNMESGLIEAVGPEQELSEKYATTNFTVDIDATGKSVLPGKFQIELFTSLGFVDGHTHPVWSGDRVHEFAMKLAGFR
jgi:imidazolonepropionase